LRVLAVATGRCRRTKFRAWQPWRTGWCARSRWRSCRTCWRTSKGVRGGPSSEGPPRRHGAEQDRKSAWFAGTGCTRRAELYDFEAELYDLEELPMGAYGCV